MVSRRAPRAEPPPRDYRDEERETRREQLLRLLEEPGWQVVRAVVQRRMNAALLAAMRPGITLEKLAEYRAEFTLLRELLADPAAWFEEHDE